MPTQHKVSLAQMPACHLPLPPWACAALLLVCNYLLLQQFPVCISDVDHEGNLRAQIIHSFNKRLSATFNGQVRRTPTARGAPAVPEPPRRRVKDGRALAIS